MIPGALLAGVCTSLDAREFARHSQAGGGVTGIYTTATIIEVALAVAPLTGEPHPLATEVSDRRGSSQSPARRE